MKILKTTFLILFAITLSAGNLIRNGNFEQWKNDLPLEWSGKGISQNKKQTEDTVSSGVRIAEKGILEFNDLKLNTNTEYILSFYMVGGNTNVQVSGVPEAVYRLGVPYMHRSGLRYYYRFRTPEKFTKTPKLIFRAGTGERTVSNITLSPALSAWNRPEFRRTGKDSAECVFTLGNSSDKSRKITGEMKLYDFFNKPLYSKTEIFELNSGAEKIFRVPFRTGDVKRYRAVLKYKYDDFSDEIWGYFNSDITKGIRKSFDLKEWQFQMVQPGTKPTENNYTPVNLPHNLKKGKTAEPSAGYYRMIFKSPLNPGRG